MNPLLIRRRGMMMAQCGLPYDSRVEYLRSDGSGQYINTGIPYDSTMEINARIRRRTSAGGNYFFGIITNIGGTYYRWALNRKSGNKISPHFGTITSVDANFSLNTWHNVYANYNTLKVDATTTNVGSAQFTPLSNVILYLFARASDVGEAEVFAECDIDTFEILVNSVTVRDYIPVRVGTVGYLYDQVSGQLFGNAGTNAFAFGADI